MSLEISQSQIFSTIADTRQTTMQAIGHETSIVMKENILLEPRTSTLAMHITKD